MEHPTVQLTSHAIDVIVMQRTAPTTVETTADMTFITVCIPDTSNFRAICRAVRQVMPRVELAHFRGLVLFNANDTIYHSLRHELEELVQECVAQDVNSGKRPEHKIAEKSGAPRPLPVPCAPRIPVAQRRDAHVAKGQHRDAHMREARAQIAHDAQLAKQLQVDTDYASALREREALIAAQLAADEELARKMADDPNFEIPPTPVAVVSSPRVYPHVSWQPSPTTTSIPPTPAYSVIGEIIPNSWFSPTHNEQYVADAIRDHKLPRGVDVSAGLLRSALNNIQEKMRANPTNVPLINVGNKPKLYNYVKATLGGPRADQWSVCQIVDILLNEQQ